MSERRVMFVTGGSRGIGAGIVIGAAAAGYDVAFTYRERQSAADEVMARTAAAAPEARCRAYQLDVRDSAAVERVGDAVLADFGTLHVVVANAAITHAGLALSTPDDAWKDVLDTNLTGAFRCVRRASKGMIRLRRGRIVLISSVVGLYGSPGQANYAASKAGLVGLARSITRELGGRGITANVVAPGFVETDMTVALPQEQQAAYRSAIPAGRFASAAEVAGVVRFVASEAAAYISGAVVPVDGGLGMGH